MKSMICFKAEELRSSRLFFLHYWQLNKLKLNGSARKLAFFKKENTSRKNK
jgi:hypothetical protein